MKITDFADLNIYIPPNKKSTLQTSVIRKIQWDTEKRQECPKCSARMIYLKWKDLKFWACLNPFCRTEERIPKGAKYDIVPICHICGSDLIWEQQFICRTINFYCKNCVLSFQV